MNFCLAVCLFAFVPAVTESIPSAVTEEIRTADTPSSLADDFRDIMEAVRKESPVLYQKLEKMPRKEALEAMLRSIGSGVRVRNEELSPREAVKYKFGRMICDNSIFYLVLPRHLNLFNLKNECIAVNRLARKPSAIILDLRTTGDDNYKDVPEIAEFLSSGDFAGYPLAVLTSRNTAGAPELLVNLLEKRKQTVTLGEAGAGWIFPVKKIHAAGTDWQIPVMEAKFGGISPNAHEPMIKCKTTPIVNYSKLADISEINKDPALRLALDMIQSIKALSGVK